MLEDAFKVCRENFQPFDLLQLDNIEMNEPPKSSDIVDSLILTRCECGKEKHGFASHSTWCKKWNQGV